MGAEERKPSPCRFSLLLLVGSGGGQGGRNKKPPCALGPRRRRAGLAWPGRSLPGFDNSVLAGGPGPGSHGTCRAQDDSLFMRGPGPA
jgi:hypothetical protein